MKQCHNCNQTNDSDALFCEDCGQKFNLNLKKECPSCHNKNEEEALFCENCGLKFNQIVTQEQTFNEQLSSVTPQKKGSKKNKIIGIVAIIILIISSATYTFLKNQYSREKQLDSLIVAIKNKDTGTLVKKSITNDPNLTLNDDSLKPMVSYFEENKEEVNKLKQALDKNQSYQGLSLKEEGKQALLFPKYSLEITAVYSTLISNVKNSTIEMNQKKIATTNNTKFEQKIGPLVPGLYHFKAAIKDKKDTKEVSYDLLPDSKEEIDMSFVMVKIPVRSNVKDATVMINDKEVGKLTDGATEIGPILWQKDLKIQLTKKTDKDKLQTEVKELKKVDLDDNETTFPTVSLDFNLASDYDIEQGVQEFYDEFSKMVDANSQYDAPQFSEKFYVDGSKNPSFTGINDYISWCRERSAKKEYSGVSFNVDVKNIEPLSNNTYKIKYNVTYRTTYPYSTKKSTRIEGFDYSDVSIQYEQESDSGKTKIFKFIDMGDGGKKVEDNHANE